MGPTFANPGADEDKTYYQGTYEQFVERKEPECLIDVLPGTTEKNDDYKIYYEQIGECMRTGIHENFVDGLEIAETTSYNALKLKDEQNRLKEYIDYEKKGQSDNNDITGETLIPDCLKYIKNIMRSILTNRDGKYKKLGDKMRPKNPTNARLTSNE